MMEIWKDIKNYEGLYQVSNLGNVKSLPKMHGIRKGNEKILKPTINSKGYLRVQLSKNKSIKQCLVHRLVAETFIENIDNLPQINHIDKNKLNNKIDNLEWCSCQYNIDYSLSKEINQYDLKGNFIRQWKSILEASRYLKIADTNIGMCCKNKYKQVGGFIFKYANEVGGNS